MATTSTTTSAGLPDYLAPYVPDMLARGQALTTSTPYQQYGGERVAGLNELQTGAAESVSGLDAGNLFTQGTGLTTQGAQYAPSAATFDTAAATQYVDPYMAGVTDIAKREAMRNSNIAGTYDESKAAQAGAFGGSRAGVVEAERERNLQTNLSDLDTRGLSAAYTNAQQQFNADQQRQQQDRQYASQAALKGGQDLTQSGTQAFGLQSTAGALQQGTEQAGLDVGYSDFLAKQQHPYEQLQFQKNLMSGYGGGTSTSTAATQPESRSGMQQFGDVLSGVGQVASIFGFAKGGKVPPRPAAKSGIGHGRVAQLYESLK